MSWEIDWTSIHHHAELRIQAGGSPGTLRFRLASQARTSRSPLFLGAEALALPVVVLPLVDRAGAPVSADRVRALLPAAARAVDGELIAPVGLAPEVDHDTGAAGDPRRLPVLWVAGLDGLATSRLYDAVELTPGLLVGADEQVDGLKGNTWPFQLYLVPLPRIVLTTRDRLADNTDAALSMGGLLEDFVQRFGDATSALPHVCIATGYLYQHGLRHVLGLLVNPHVTDLRLLFSGQTDRASARALTRAFAQELDDALEGDPPDALWRTLHAAAEAGRLQVRIYTRAFLHAKLFLGWERPDRDGFLSGGVAVMGSSNVTAPGLAASGNLELNITVEERHQLQALHRWFEARWEEAELPEPALMEVLEARAPAQAPTFAIAGLAEVWEAGQRGRLLPPAHHLALLVDLHRDELGLLPRTDLPPWEPAHTMEIVPAPEQDDGVLAVVHRLLAARVAFLADSVGLGKTITALGAAWYMRRLGASQRAVLIAPRKLFGQWRTDMRLIDAPADLVGLLNRHGLERASEEQALKDLEGADLIVVEEAHEALRKRSNRLWTHLRAFLRANRGARLLLISATPWNNRREDIFNYLVLAWADIALLERTYPLLAGPPVRSHAGTFMLRPSPAAAVRAFELMDVHRYRRIFATAFIQRTRSSVTRRYGRMLDFPRRRVYADSAGVSAPHDAFFTRLKEALPRLHMPHLQPFTALRIATHQRGLLPGEAPTSNLLRRLVIHLYKRAESSLLALAVSLRNTLRSLDALAQELWAIQAAASPKAALVAWFAARTRLDEGEEEEELLLGQGALAVEERLEQRVAAHPLLQRLDDRGAQEVALQLVGGQIEPDRVELRQLLEGLTLELERSEPKGQTLLRLAADHFRRGHKPVLIASYADTAVRTFIALCRWLPEACIGLALGGSEGWIHVPAQHASAPLADAEWGALLDEPDAQRRRDLLLGAAGRATPLAREDVIALFAPTAQHTQHLQPDLLREHRAIDVLIGSEAISVGQNLQDSTALIHLDLPWNPMVMEQRIGRIDRRGGGRVEPGEEGRVVDIHYCWSLGAIEREVELRTRLTAKAKGALGDTDFDELLLLDLHEAIKETRRQRGAGPGVDEQAALRRVLDERQRALADEQGRVPGADGAAPGLLDGLRRLREAAERHMPLPALSAARPVACAVACAAPWRWTLTLEVRALDSRGDVLGTSLLHAAIDDGAAEPPPSELDGAVQALDEAAARRAARRPGDRPGWTPSLVALDQRLQGWQRRLRDDHNQEVDARVSAALEPAARRDPSELLRGYMLKAREHLERLMRGLNASADGKAFLAREVARLRFLFGALDPKDADALLAAASNEAELNAALIDLKELRADELQARLDGLFAILCGTLWAASQSGAAATGETPAASLPVEVRWASVEVRVLGATWRDTPRREGMP